MPKTSDKGKTLLLESIAAARDTFGCTVKCIVTDNEKKMQKMRAELQKEDSSLISYGCASHWLNLLGVDITPDSVIKHIVDIQKYFRNHHLPNAWLCDIPGSIKPQLPCETRWKSQMNCLDTFLHNRTLYLQIVQEHEDDMDQNISRKIMDMNIYRQAKDLCAMLRPMANAIDATQRDAATIADATDVFLSLLRDPELLPHRKAVEKRFSQAILPCHMAAYLLHPRYRGKYLSSQQLETAKSWIQERDPDYLEFVMAFQGQDSPFPPSSFSDSATKVLPHAWWKVWYNLLVCLYTL